MNLSKRLQVVADLAGNGGVICDVGTDHGYIPIYLVKNGYFEKGLAMDINEGPLQRARENVKEYGISDRIETRLSDGLFALREKEADTIVIAGMGGILTARILNENLAVAKSAEKLILSPHSDVALLRDFLFDKGFRIEDEKMAFQAGKYYFVLKCTVGKDIERNAFEREYGSFLASGKDRVFFDYLMKEKEKLDEIKQRISKGSFCADEKLKAVDEKLFLLGKEIERW